MTTARPTTTRPRASLRERLAVWVFFTKLSFLLDDLPRRRSKEIAADLRTHLADAATARGWEAALADLGPVGRLAQEYKDAEGAALPRWLSGGVAALVVGLLWTQTTLAYAFGLVDGSEGLAAVSGGRSEVSGSFLWTDVTALHTADGFSAQLSGVGPLVLLVVLLLVYLLVARVWRLRRR